MLRYILIVLLLPSISFAKLPNEYFNHPDNYISVAFKSASLSELVLFVAEQSDSSFTLSFPPDEEPKITWVADNIHLNKLADTFVNSLISQGLVVRDLDNTGNNFAISETSSPLATSKSSFGYYRLKFITADSFADLSENFYKNRVAISPVGNSTILVAGSGYDVSQFLTVVKSVDKPTDKDLYSVVLKNIPVKTAVDALNGSAYGIDERLKYYPDYWNKSVILRGDLHLVTNAKAFLYSIDKARTGHVDQLCFLSSISSAPAIEILQGSFPDLQVKPVADDRLYIAGNAKDVKLASDLLGKLDATGVQVRIEAVVAYLTDKEYEELGVRFIASTNDFRIGLNDPLFGNSFSLLSKGFEQFLRIDVSAEDNESRGSIISSPVLTVLNGHQATLHVGQNVPYLSEANVDKNDGDTTGTSIERADVGMNFSVTPIIDPSREFVNVKLDQVISSIAKDSNIGDTIDIIFDEQKLSSVVRVANGETIFLGGLTVDEKGTSIERIPFLGYIPILGQVFTYKGDRVEKRNLVVSLRVKILGA
ncbi:MAG: hypothetical protein OCC45_06435 [Desulfotalea sp.]